MREVRICATLSPYTRDDPRYWETHPHSEHHPQPADHNEAGFFVESPEERHQPIAELVADTLSAYTPETPMAARARTSATRAYRRRVLARQLSFVQSALQIDGPFVRRGPTRWRLA